MLALSEAVRSSLQLVREDLMASEGGKGGRGDRLGKENREKWISRQWR